MADSEFLFRLLNHFMLDLEEMEMKLKCPSCYKLLDQPIVLPCYHVICSPCVTGLTNGPLCLSCNLHFLHEDLRPDLQIKTFVNMYKDMNSSVSATFRNQRPQDIPNNIPASRRDYAVVKSEAVVPNMGKEHPFTPPLDNSSSKNTNTSKPIKEEHNGPAAQGSKNMHCMGGEAFVDQGSQHIAPSVGDIKDSDSNGKRSEHRARRSTTRVACEEDLPVEDKHISEHDSRELKRQKLNDEFDVGCKSGTSTGDFLPNSEPELKTVSIPEVQPLHPSSLLGETMLVNCMFCHSFRTTEASGKMQHYLNRKLVEADQASQPNVFHVHEKCVDWAPQIYFKGDIIMNLEAELSRALKIKCSSCGKKGAALGCYVKSCRKSFHVPCAYEILDCRWDCENYHVLCPAHSSCKLPCDKSQSKSTQKINHSLMKDLSSPQGELPALKKQHNCEQWTDSSNVSRNWVLCGSALSDEEKGALVKFADLSGATVTRSWKPDVTHVIASTDADGACNRTLKFLMAILCGKWVVNMKWIEDCISHGHSVGEESYEVSHDVHGFFDGPRRGRIRVTDKAPKLFVGLSFYFNGYFRHSFKCQLESLILAAGGIVLKKDDLMDIQNSASKGIASKVLVVYNSEPLEDDLTTCDKSLENERKVAEALACNVGGRIIPHAWVLDSIATCNMKLS